MARISIIVPVYNVIDYLDDCMRSILNQDYKDFEVILIDDCSTDGSKELVEYYATQYGTMIRAYYQKNNMKQGTARNVGIKYATGEYLMFVDSDDMIPYNSLSLLFNQAQKTGADIVFGDYEYFEKNDIKGETYSHISSILSGKLTEGKRKALITTSVVPWAKLIRKKLITENDIWFPENIIYEDQATTYLYYLYAKSIAKVNGVVYRYRKRGDSTTGGIRIEKSFQQVNSAELLIKRIQNRGFYNQYKEEVDFFAISQMYCQVLEIWLEKYDYSEKLLNNLDELRRVFNKYCSEYLENKYYINNMSQYQQKLIEFHKKSSQYLLDRYNAGCINDFCLNYSLQLINNKEKLKKLKEYIGINRIKIALWGAGKTGINILKAFEKVGIIVSYITDSNENLNGKQYYDKYQVMPFDVICHCVDLVIIELTCFKENIHRRIGGKVSSLDLEAYVKYNISSSVEDYFE